LSKRLKSTISKGYGDDGGAIMTVKQLIFRIFFGAEILFFSWTYFLGPQGMYALWAIDKDHQELKAHNQALEAEGNKLQKYIDAWGQKPFFKEKYAREKLQMAYPSEEIYFLS
jgi:cell division protein FtsB